jgi:hypothetical protein
MNVQMENINVTQRDGRVTHLDRVYIRGSHVRLFIVPDMLRYEEICCRKKLRIFADRIPTGMRPCSDLATLVVAALVSPEVVPLSTAPVASAVLPPDKRGNMLVSTASRRVPQIDMRLESAKCRIGACHGG